MARLMPPILLTLLGIIYLVLTLNVQRSRIGDPNSPMYFPLLISVLLIVMSVIYFFQEYKKRHEHFEILDLLLQKKTLIRLGATVVMIIIYALIFERLGFLISTILFLGGVLFLINGVKHWLQNIIVALVFSGITWYAFSQLLDVSLP